MSRRKYFTGEHTDRLAIDITVRAMLGVERGQTIGEVAARIAATALPSPALHAARVLLNETKRPDVWERMALAARILGWRADGLCQPTEARP